MMLAAISFSDPVMLAGLAAAGIPVALHLLNRIRSPIVMFPTLRFLKITAMKTSRRRQVQQYLLLLLRMAVFAMIAMAISRPLIRGGSSSLAYGFVVMFLAGLAALVMAGIWGAEAVRKKSEARSRKQEGEVGADEMAKGAHPGHAQRGPYPAGHGTQSGAGRYFGMSGLAGVAALLMVAGSVYGLTSDRYFSADKGVFSERSAAVVIVLDNSYSMLAREDAATRFGRAKDQVRQILAETVKPLEAAIVVTNPGGTAVGEDHMTGDMTRLLGYLDKLEVVGRARPMKERIRQAAQMLEGATEGSKMLIVVSDYARNAFEDAEVFDAVKELPGGKDLQVVLMPMGKGSAPADVGIASFAVAEGGGMPVVGNEIVFQAEVVNNGDAGEVKELEFLVDDAVVEGVRPQAQLGAGGTGSGRKTITIPYRLTSAGAHRFAVRLVDVKDAMAWDDQRELVLDVAEQVKVLVVGGEEKVRPRSAAFYFLAALAPFGNETANGRNGESAKVWSILPRYRGIGEVKDYGSLAGYSAVFMCDVPRVDDAVADALAKYVKEGGRVVWVLGASVDGAEYNQVLLGNGRELLPGVLAAPVTSPGGSVVDWVDLQSPLFGGLFDNQEPFRSVVVTGRWGFQGGVLSRGRALGKLADGNLIMAQHSGAGGGGDIYTVLTSPSAAWSNLGATVLLVPLASRMALGDSGRFKLETSYDPGENLLIRVPGADQAMRNMNLDVTTPSKAVVNCRAVMSGDVPRWYFDKTQEVGVYRWRSTDGKHAGMFVVNPPGEEVDLQAADVEGLAREVATNRPAIVAGSAAELLSQLEKRSEGTTLAPGVLALVLMLAVLEGLMANRGRPGGRARGVGIAEGVAVGA